MYFHLLCLGMDNRINVQNGIRCLPFSHQFANVIHFLTLENQLKISPHFVLYALWKPHVKAGKEPLVPHKQIIEYKESPSNCAIKWRSCIFANSLSLLLTGDISSRFSEGSVNEYKKRWRYQLLSWSYRCAVFRQSCIDYK